MIFLMEYNRLEGEIVSLRAFEETERAEAEGLRLSLELRLGQAKVDHEVVLLEADSEAALRTTHRRYFSEPRSMLDPNSFKLS